MKKVITLGPTGTYSEIAARKFIQNLNLKATLSFEPSIDLCFEALKTHDLLVLPLENSIDGYVQRTLDLLNFYDHYFMTHEINVPISFSLISNETSLNDVETIYVQFKAKNQCLNFLNQLKNVKYIITDSNVESLNLHLKHQQKSAAIVPLHLVQEMHELIIHNVQDIEHNQTRFIVIEKGLELNHLQTNLKMMIVLSPDTDKPGLLYELLGNFKKLHINLSSIMSRPRKNKPGTYHFFIELNIQKEIMDELIQTLHSSINLNIKILGVYE